MEHLVITICGQKKHELQHWYNNGLPNKDQKYKVVVLARCAVIVHSYFDSDFDTKLVGIQDIITGQTFIITNDEEYIEITKKVYIEKQLDLF